MVVTTGLASAKIMWNKTFLNSVGLNLHAALGKQAFAFIFNIYTTSGTARSHTDCPSVVNYSL